MIVNYKPEHYDRLIEQGHLGFTKTDEAMEAEKIALAQENVTTYTYLMQDKVLLIGGVLVMWPGFGEVWAMYSNEIKKRDYMVEAFSVSQDMINTFIEKLHLFRLNATCRITEKRYARWLERLGFRLNTEMEMYYPNKETALLYEILIER